MARERARYEEGIGLDDEEGLFGDDAPREERTVGARTRGETSSTTTGATWRPGRRCASRPRSPKRKKSPLELELEQWGVRLPSADEAEDEVDADGDVVLADETETEEGKTTRSDDDAAAEDSRRPAPRLGFARATKVPLRGNPSTRSRASMDRSRMDGSPSRETPIDRERRRRRTRTPRRTRSRSIGRRRRRRRRSRARDVILNDDLLFTTSRGSGAATWPPPTPRASRRLWPWKLRQPRRRRLRRRRLRRRRARLRRLGPRRPPTQNAPAGNLPTPSPANDASTNVSDDETDVPTLAALRTSMKEKEAANRPPTSKPPSRTPGVLVERREFAPAPAEEDSDGGAVDVRLRPPAVDDASGGFAAASSPKGWRIRVRAVRAAHSPIAESTGFGGFDAIRGSIHRRRRSVFIARRLSQGGDAQRVRVRGRVGGGGGERRSVGKRGVGETTRTEEEQDPDADV